MIADWIDAELEAAINELGGVRVDVQCARLEVTEISDQRPRWAYQLFVDVGGETVTVYP